MPVVVFKFTLVCALLARNFVQWARVVTQFARLASTMQQIQWLAEIRTGFGFWAWSADEQTVLVKVQQAC